MESISIIESNNKEYEESQNEPNLILKILFSVIIYLIFFIILPMFGSNTLFNEEYALRELLINSMLAFSIIIPIYLRKKRYKIISFFALFILFFSIISKYETLFVNDFIPANIFLLIFITIFLFIMTVIFSRFLFNNFNFFKIGIFLLLIIILLFFSINIFLIGFSTMNDIKTIYYLQCNWKDMGTDELTRECNKIGDSFNSEKASVSYFTLSWKEVRNQCLDGVEMINQGKDMNFNKSLHEQRPYINTIFRMQSNCLFFFDTGLLKKGSKDKGGLFATSDKPSHRVTERECNEIRVEENRELCKKAISL